MRPVPRTPLMLAALAFAMPALAQTEPDPADAPEIVVTAQQTEGEIKDFVGALSQGSTFDQLTRFETRAACPVALGVSDGQRSAIVDRMRRVAKSAGVPLATGDCKPNVIVIVTSDRKAFIDGLARKHPAYIEALTAREVRALSTSRARAVAWQLAGPELNADGTEIPVDLASGLPVNRTIRQGSRITAPTRPNVAAAVVIVDSAALVGLTTTQLADYAAMRAFARTDPAQLTASNAPTILKVLDAPDGSAVPVTLTHWDLGFLRGLYAAPDNAYAAAQRSAIRKSVQNELQPKDGKRD